jgi:Cupin-like domain
MRGGRGPALYLVSSGGHRPALRGSHRQHYEKYPLFREIREQALCAELELGDGIYIPKLWWHQIESTASFNGLVNYWWDAFAGGPDAPYTSLLLGMIAIAERPPRERRAWKDDIPDKNIYSYETMHRPAESRTFKKDL